MTKLSGEEGFSLIELTIATVLLGTVMVAFFGFYASVINSPRLINENTIALNLARDRIEFLRQFENKNFDRNNAVWNTKPDGTVGTNPISYTLNDHNIEFTISSNIHPETDNSLDSSIRTDVSFIPVTVTVKWKSDGKDKSIDFTTMFSQKY